MSQRGWARPPIAQQIETVAGKFHWTRLRTALRADDIHQQNARRAWARQ